MGNKQWIGNHNGIILYENRTDQSTLKINVNKF